MSTLPAARLAACRRRSADRTPPGRLCGPIDHRTTKKECIMKTLTSLIAMAAELPLPPPGGTETADTSGDQSGSISGTPLPGSRGDFLQSVPSDRVFFDTDSYSIDAQSRAT